MDIDLPLFRWEPPKRVILFPLTSRLGKVRHTAELLSQKHGEEAELYWKQVVAGIRRHLDRVGITGADADHEIRAFFDAVQGELHRMAYEGPLTGRLTREATRHETSPDLPSRFDLLIEAKPTSRIIWTAEAIAQRIGCSADYVRHTLVKVPGSPVKKIGTRYCAHEGDLLAFFRA